MLPSSPPEESVIPVVLFGADPQNATATLFEMRLCMPMITTHPVVLVVFWGGVGVSSFGGWGVTWRNHQMAGQHGQVCGTHQAGRLSQLETECVHFSVVCSIIHTSESPLCSKPDSTTLFTSSTRVPNVDLARTRQMPSRPSQSHHLSV